MTEKLAGSLERRFTTRHYPYRGGCGRPVLEDEADPLADIAPGSVVRFFLGSDDAPILLGGKDLANQVADPFAKLVLIPGRRPQSLTDLLAVLDADTSVDAVPGQRTYRIAEGGQIPWTEDTADLARNFRLVVTRHRGDEAELFISTTSPFVSTTIFLQVFAWDPRAGAYNFYERRRGVWSWAGSSWQALAQGTRGLGPFDSHVNGATVMKELKLPWLHWHSESAPLQDDFLAPDDPLRTDPLYRLEPPKGLRGAEDLERIVRAGIARWTRSRFDRAVVGGVLANAPSFWRHLLTTTTVNLTSSPDRSWILEAGDFVRLPTSFFLNTDLLLVDLGIPASLARLKIEAATYQTVLQRYAVRLQDGATSLERDAFFAFAVPEASAEDRSVVAGLVERHILSRRLTASLLMVDFPNPIFSPRREALLVHLPADPKADVEARFVASVRASSGAAAADSPEAEFLGWWDRGDADWDQAMARALEAYWAALAARLATENGFDAVFRLAEWRRRQFRHRPLAEFGLTLAVATALETADPLMMTATGDVVPVMGGRNADATI